MKKKSLLTTLLLILGLGSYTVLNTSSSGGFSSYQGNCNCHGGTNSATSVAINGLPANYTPGQSYPITVTVSNASLSWAGFQIQANIGTLTSADADVTIQGGNMSAGHNKRKAIAGGTSTFSLTWIAPTPGGVAANFNAVGNAVNGSGTGGDAWNAAASTNVALPVIFSNVSAFQQADQIVVNFETLDEINVKQFQVERSSDASNYSQLETIEPNEKNKYSMVDFPSEINKTHYYRVKEISNDNEEFYSEVVAVNFISDKNISIFPTVVESNTINVTGIDLSQNNTIVLFDFMGRKVWTENLSTNQQVLPNLNKGLYFITLLENNKLLKSQKVIIP